MHRARRTLTVAAAALVMMAASYGGASASGASSAPKTITIGVLADITGAGSDTDSSFPAGIKAGIGAVAKDGYHIKYVVADTTTSPTGAETAAQKLVEQDHVFAVLLASVVGFGAAPYLASQGIPVIGCACDATEWITDRNMFSVIGAQNYNNVQTTYGLFFKDHGVTNIGTVGYSIEPSSEDVAKDSALSAEKEGIKVGYINTNFPLGSTNVAPIALEMKSAGINGLSSAILTNSTFAIIAALEQDGVKLKAALPPTGYGGDLTQAGPAAEQEAQGIYFLSGYEPVEMNTAATKLLQSSLKTYADVPGLPTFAEYLGYASVLALVDGLKAAGKSPTQASLIKAMLGIRSWNAGGLYGDHSIGWAMDQRGEYMSADDCVFITQFRGTTFHLVPGEDPLCGKNVPGETIADAPSS